MRSRLTRSDAGLARLGWVACLALPLALLHARALAEILIVAIDLLFLAHVWAVRDLSWMRHGFSRAAMAWWGWVALCSLLGHGLPLGLAAVRLPLLAVAIGWWLADGARTRLLWALLAACFVWIGLECWQQYLTGHNMFGHARWGDGALTGPFNKPRAGPAFILLFFPVVVPAAMALLGGPTVWRKLAGGGAVALAALTMLLIGQRMPSVLMVLGLAVTAVLLPRLRVAVVAAGLAGGLLVAALPLVSPAAETKLVAQTADQLRHFPQSDYGLILGRALGVARDHPWLGLGFDGFRHACAAELRYTRIQGVLPPPAIRACNLHPHNYYLEAADNGGWPGLALFSAMVLTALASLGAGLWRGPDRVRVGFFVGALVALFPAASTSAFTSMPNGGWVFLLLGMGLSLGWRERRPPSLVLGRLHDGFTGQ